MFFHSERLHDHATFMRAYHGLAIPERERVTAIARWLDVTPATVKAWITGTRQPPRSTVYALWHESSEGRHVTHTHLFNEARLHAGRVRTLDDLRAGHEATIAALRQELAELKADRAAHVPANDSAFTDVPPPPFAASRTPTLRGRRPDSRYQRP